MYRRILVFALFLLCVLAAGFCDGWQEYSSEAFLFSVSHPAGWYVNPVENRVEIFSQRDFTDAMGGGVGVVIAVYPLELDDGSDPLKAMEHIEDEFGSSIDTSSPLMRMVSGEQWVMCPFDEDEVSAGKILCVIRGFFVYFIAYGYSDAEKISVFEQDINQIIDSFQLIDFSYKQHIDGNREISFEYPSHWHVFTNHDSITVSTREGVEDDTAGALIMVGKMEIPSGSTDDAKMDEAALFQEIAGNDDVTVIAGPQSISFKGKTWLYGELTGATFKGYIYLSKQGNVMYSIGLLVNPFEKDDEVSEIFQHFLDTLEFSWIE
ncbi:MAG: hypothetical protein JW904_00245 [Spirochaetales bacterium]|nr:hypothetical protein [Spirochaetales bacterium]